MKKIVSLVLTLAMMCSLCVTVALADSTTETLTTSLPSADKDITVVVDPYDSSTTVYSVDITWTSLAFAYNKGSQGTWQPGNHSYNGGVASSWTSGELSFTVTNHSNAEVKYKASWERANPANGSADAELGTPTNANGGNLTDGVTLAAGVVGQYENAANSSFSLTAKGAPDNSAKVGTLTVSFDTVP